MLGCPRAPKYQARMLVLTRTTRTGYISQGWKCSQALTRLARTGRGPWTGNQAVDAMPSLKGNKVSDLPTLIPSTPIPNNEEVLLCP